MENPDCPKCQSCSVKNGFVQSHQRWKCKGCGFQFTRLEPKGKPLWMKLLANLLYISGNSLNSIAQNLGVSTPSVLDWVRDFARANYEKPQPEGEGIVVAELDEMGHVMGSKKTRSGYGKPLIVLAGDSSTGKLEIAMLKPLKNCSNASVNGRGLFIAQMIGRLTRKRLRKTVLLPIMSLAKAKRSVLNATTQILVTGWAGFIERPKSFQKAWRGLI